ncbi:LysR substrate-binding domain-containing protein [Pseudomonas sp. DTU_2021_1001937_2_SI_NGA_ILE_001]|uniref:LysR substrate-binding domain-containing protein n=1 Tax=Pseudomonas sp. DTU_2021_1001937_2_SI_NGA_ILE_001 TaxID=3077589 RepID=UPI0025E13056|nr:LysR substrate-binding domain-containing protein [Pseudomonas sp. DTU_2021_1001937_2_SI_NGA_ILE_001]WNW12533.1 LysR substrate-binding domain-containing protein [Pseudomonas sp. DTU_2021_1001937_2_SI_NGA_ILE_001]
MNLESKWLEDFSALAATRSFSQAAERRFVTQPAFSRRIRSLEAALGLTLVNRSRTPIELTAAGQLFLVTARNVVEQLGEVVRHLHHLEGGQGEVIQVAAAHSLALGFFPRWIAQLRNDGLNIATRLVATNVGEAVHALREGGCDLMLAFYDPDAALQMDAEIFPSLHLAHTEMLPVCAADAQGQPLYDLDGGASVPLLAYSAGAFLGRSVNLLLRQSNLRFTTVYETAMAESLKCMAVEGLGVAWVPRLSMRAELERGELVVCGGAHWHVPLEIRLYRCALVRKANVRLLWRKLESGMAQAEAPPAIMAP